MTPSDSPIETRDTPITHDVQISNPDVKELHDLLTDQGWQTKFVAVQTIPQQQAIDTLHSGITKLAKKTAGIRLRAEVSEPQEKDFRAGKYNQFFAEEKEKGLTEAAEQTRKLQEDLTASQIKNAQAVQDLVKEVELSKDDPQLINALAVWGRSPNHANERGSDGRGFNAGMIHFFEYRAFADKLGHNRRDNMTLDGFINRSRAVNLLVNSPDAAQSVISQSHTLQDETGKQARYLLTKAGELVIAYKEAGSDRFKVVTVISGQNIQVLNKRFDEEIKSPLEQRMKRLNHLGSIVKTV